MIQKTPEKLAHPDTRASKSTLIYEGLKAFVIASEPDRAIAPERRLAAEYGVTVGTIRRALKRLASEELIYTVHGKGSFVAARPEEVVAQRILLVDDWGDTTHPFYINRLRGLATQAGAFGFRLEVIACPNHMRGEEAERLVDAVRSPEVLGMVVPWLDPPRYRAIRDANPHVHIVSTISELHEPGAISVLPDYAAMGRLAATYLSSQGATRIATMGIFHDAFLAASRVITSIDGATMIDEMPSHLATNAVAAAEWLIAQAPDGIAFFDDRLARDMLMVLTQKAPQFWHGRYAISASNTGDDILPPTMARLEIDGTRLGALAIHAIRSMQEGIELANTRILVSPRFIAPQDAMRLEE